MKGRNKFSDLQAKAIRTLLQKIRSASRQDQKMLRRSLRQRYGFFISDFSTSGRGFSEDDFNERVREGVIGVYKSGQAVLQDRSASTLAFSWSAWQAFPDPRSGGILTAPFGPGVYELRNRKTDERVLFGMAKNVASRMSSLLPCPLGTGTRNNMKKRTYVCKHLGYIEYRSKPCADGAAAAVEEGLLRENRHRYVFPT